MTPKMNISVMPKKDTILGQKLILIVSLEALCRSYRYNKGPYLCFLIMVEASPAKYPSLIYPFATHFMFGKCSVADPFFPLDKLPEPAWTVCRRSAGRPRIRPGSCRWRRGYGPGTQTYLS